MNKVPFTNLPGFSRYDNADFYHLFYEQSNASDLYENFKAKVLKSVENPFFLPIMRMCDGEYTYCVGKKVGFNQSFIQKVRSIIAATVKLQMTSWGERYSRKQNRILKRKFPSYLKSIASHGFIANHFMYTPSRFCEEYIQPMQRWYKRHDIILDSNNYTAFYFVYILLNGKDSLDLFKNRNILVISSFDVEKSKSVESELLRRGASNVFFESISATQSMLDKLNLVKYKNIVQIVLIAGGIGSANILLQCKELNVLCIDSGFCLECIADSSKRVERIYCKPDIDF